VSWSLPADGTTFTAEHAEDAEKVSTLVDGMDEMDTPDVLYGMLNSR
jgi:hypothetical protein